MRAGSGGLRASRVREVHRFSIDVILRSLCQVTTAARFIGALEAAAGDAVALAVPMLMLTRTPMNNHRVKAALVGTFPTQPAVQAARLAATPVWRP